MAAALSVVPGLGQLYNGQSARGLLFMDVAAVNFVMLWLILFTEPVVRTISAFSTEFHVRPNEELLHALNQMHVGTPVSSAVLLLIFGFVFYAARDAYDSAKKKRLQAIYPDHAIQMPEAASGSYLLHLSMIVTCALLALFFILPPPPRTQVTDIEFIETNRQLERPKHATKVSDHSAKATAEHDPNRRVAVARSESKPASHTAQPQKAVAETHVAHPVQPKVATPPAAVAAPPRQVPTTPVAPTVPAFHPHLVNVTRPAVAPALPPATVHTNVAPQPMPQPLNTARTSMPALPLPQPMAHGSSQSVQPMPTAQPLLAMAGPGHSPAPHASATTGNTAAAQPTAPGPVHATKPGSGTLQPQPAATHGPIGPASPATDPGPVPTRFGQDRPGHNGSPLATTPSVGNSIAQRPNSDTASRDHGDGPAVTEVEFGPYMALLQRRIKSHWFPPRVPTSKQVKVMFKISRSGELSGLKVARSSGLAEADQGALKAVEEAAPFPHLPAGADSTVDIEFTFDYNVFGTGQSHMRMF